MHEALRVLQVALDGEAAAGRQRAFWWRDDDAVDTGPRLDALLALAARHDAPVALAVIPAFVSDRLLRACEHRGVAVLQHGARHENHEPAGKKAELGPARAVPEILAECVAVRARIEGSPAFVPVMVPPWNRMREDLAEALATAGYRGVSCFAGPARAAPLRRVDTHVDPVAWRGDRGLAPPHALEAMVRAALSRPGAIGLLTHHAVHTGDVDDFVAGFAALVTGHPGAVWRDPASLFPAGPEACR